MGLFPQDLARRCAADGEFLLAARAWSGSIVLSAGTEQVAMVLVDGRPEPGGAQGVGRGPGHLALRAPAETWEQLLSPVPPPYRNDLLPAQAFGLAIEGDRETSWQYFPALRRLVELCRPAPAPLQGTTPPVRPSGRLPRFDAPLGRYVHLDLEGIDHRVYFEEAGIGVPLVLQHTAGSHGVQWRHLFEDPWITSHFRLVAYDLPYHGKSLPPESQRWWEYQYRLTTRFAMSVPLALADTLELERPAFMGCSIGGSLALDLARWHPGRFRAVIALEPSLKIDTDLEELAGFWHPRVSSDFKAQAMYGLMAPQSPEPAKRETVFSYSQGWPPLFLGDLHYYLVDHDLRAEAHTIDTTATAVHLLTGEYDYSATVAHGQAAHDGIGGSTFTVMDGLGHFPMCEDPIRFLGFLRPVLEQILAAG